MRRGNRGIDGGTILNALNPLPPRSGPASKHAVASDRWIRATAFVLTGIALVGVLVVNLLVPLLAGLLLYELVHLFTPYAQRYLSTRRGKLIVVALFAILMIVLFVTAVLALIAYFRSSAGNLGGLLGKISMVLERARAELPEALVGYLPVDAVELQDAIAEWLRDHLNDLQTVGAHTALLFAETLIALVIGAALSLQDVVNRPTPGPLGFYLIERTRRFAGAFHHVAISQLRISLVNTAFTAIYLLFVLPLFGTHLPFTKTIIAITFVVGLLPVIGNLVSNSIIVVVSLGQSTSTAIASLAFLIAIHKLEYFLDARIVGSKINARVWELLIAMLVMQACFGVAGLVAAPIYYAYLKSELLDAKLL